MSAHQPVGDLVSVAAAGSSAQSSAIPQKTQYLRVIAITNDAHVAIGTNPTATTSNYWLVAGRPEVISIGQPRSQPVVGITTGATTVLEFQEGTGSQFTVGDTVSLTVTGQSSYDFSDKIVTAVNAKSASGSGDGTQGFSRIITVANDSSTGNPAALLSSSYAELRNVFKVAGIKAGSSNSNIKAQQVQVVGG